MSQLPTVDGPWYLGCDHRFLYDKAKDVDGNYLNDGTCAYTITDRDDTILSQAGIPYVLASDGRYQVNVDKAAVPNTVPYGSVVTLTVTFSDNGNDDTRVLRLMVERRR